MNYEHLILWHLIRAYDEADSNDNFALNDAGGCKFCREIKDDLKPIIDKVKKEIEIHKISKKNTKI